MMGVVKADAYGHGAVPCARTILEAGADVLGVGITAPIHVLVGVFPDEIEELLAHKLSTTLCSLEIAEALSRNAKKLNKTAEVHIKADTGMGRLGVTLQELPDFMKQVTALPNLSIESLFTHLSCADQDEEYTRLQLQRLDEIRKTLANQSGLALPLHCANSAGLLNFPESHYQMVRPGIALYGALPPAPPEAEKASIDLKPVMHWKTRILQIRDLPKGSNLSYGKNFVTERNSRIAVLPVGYADGLNRVLSGRMDVLVRGERVKQVGTICMDMTLVDVTDVPEVREGEEVVLLGQQGDQSIKAEEMAELCGTIPYEIFCNVGKRVPRNHLP